MQLCFFSNTFFYCSINFAYCSSNANLNVRDPHYSAVYGNPYLRTSLVEQTYLLTDEGPDYPPTAESPYHPAYGDRQNNGGGHPVYGMYSVTPGGSGSVPAHYIIRNDQLKNSLATHV
jgi:hypothetical protein